MDEEFQAALTEFLRSWLRPEWLAEHGEENFEQVLNLTANGNVGMMLRKFHEKTGRYPTYSELFPPGSPIVGWDPLESTCRHASLSIL